MRTRSYWICILASAIWIPHAWADIYSWRDADGIRHISNINPPAHAEVLIPTEERDFDEATVQAQQEEAEEQQIQLREREAQLARREAELERRLDETEQKANEVLQETEQRIAVVEACYASWATDCCYVIPTTTYCYRPCGGPHYRRKPSRYRSNHGPGHGLGRPSLTGRPFHLGAIHLPLGTIGFARRPYPGGTEEHPRHPGGRQR